MRLRTLGLAALLAAGVYQQNSDAFVRQKGVDAPQVTAVQQGPRMHPNTTFARPSRVAAAGFAGWTAIWDQDTDVPLRLWGATPIVQGSVADPAIAERVAREFLAAHIATLAPGAAVSDFVLAGNQTSPQGDIRSVGFFQMKNGLRVLGGQIGFSFKADRLIMVSSTALPHVLAPIPATQLSPMAVATAATRWLAKSGFQTSSLIGSQLIGTGSRVIVPIVRPRIGIAPDITYRVAEQTALAETTGYGRWKVWVDASDGSPIMRQNQLMYLSGKVLFDVPDRGPQGTRHPQPAMFDTFTVNGAAVTAGADGSVTFATSPAQVQLKLTGTFVQIIPASGTLVTGTQSLASGGTTTFTQATNERNDAQLDSYFFANQIKAFAKARINPGLAYLNQVIQVNVNENQTCNAFSTGDDIHFFIADNQCENTGRISDVVEHEFGHSLHNNSIIPGQGAFDGSLSEGLADTTALLISGDPGLGRGFFKATPNDPLRNLEPATPKHFPEDADGEVHDEGEIIGEALWDTRKALEAKFGQADGFTKFIPIYYGIMQRAQGLTTSFAEALVADDDNGNIQDGTPNQCEIQAAFNRHGLADASVSGGIGIPTRDNFTVSVDVNPGSNAACPGPAVTSAKIAWQLRGTSTAGSVDMAMNGTTFAGDIPPAPDGTVVQYKVTITLADNSVIEYPQNKADPLYEFYVGDVTPLYCTDFESGAADWTHGGDGDEWQAGPPMGLGGDPPVAHGGTGVFGLDLSNDGIYSDNVTSAFAESPDIDLKGNTHVRLQYFRWLGVEDGFYDKATISANGAPMFNNFTSATDPQFDEVNHIDKEWRFQDVDLSAQTGSGKIKVRFDLSSDQGLGFGGWTLDDLCVVAITGPAATCGNNQVDDGESCDDGNRTSGDGCDMNCQDENGGGDGGCCSANTNPVGALAMSLLTIGVVLRRRRRTV
jgi:cysteine-rich repeat protein